MSRNELLKIIDAPEIWANGLAKNPGSLSLTIGMPQTNMVFPALAKSVKESNLEMEKALSKEGIKGGYCFQAGFSGLVTHYLDQPMADVQKTVQSFDIY